MRWVEVKPPCFKGARMPPIGHASQLNPSKIWMCVEMLLRELDDCVQHLVYMGT